MLLGHQFIVKVFVLIKVTRNLRLNKSIYCHLCYTVIEKKKKVNKKKKNLQVFGTKARTLKKHFSTAEISIPMTETL